jgi:basic amino acid/polyamine antiporter, APA family
VLRHFLIPLFGIVANLACMAFYLIGPFMGYGTKMEPLLALGIAFAWAALRRAPLRQYRQGPR